MKAYILLFLVSASYLPAQDAGMDRVVIPAHNGQRSRMVSVNIINGGVTVKAYSGQDVIVETSDAGVSGRHTDRDRRTNAAESDGLKRLVLPGNSGLEIDEDEGGIKIRVLPSHFVNLIVSVPKETNVKLHCTNGGTIVVEGIHGEIDVQNLNGRITLNHVSGTVVAHSLNGNIKASLDRIDSGKPISFSTLNGEVDVTLPSDFRANLKLKTDNGDIFSDFDIKLDNSRNHAIVESTNDNKFHVKADRSLYGTLNGGGQEAVFTTFTGRISIRKQK